MGDDISDHFITSRYTEPFDSRAVDRPRGRPPVGMCASTPGWATFAREILPNPLIKGKYVPCPPGDHEGRPKITNGKEPTQGNSPGAGGWDISS